MDANGLDWNITPGSFGGRGLRSGPYELLGAQNAWLGSGSIPWFRVQGGDLMLLIDSRQRPDEDDGVCPPDISECAVSGAIVKQAGWWDLGLLTTSSPLGSGTANNSSWGWNFTKAFFGGLVSKAGWKAVYHSFGEGGCDRLMAETFADAFNPLPGDGVGPSDVAELGPKAVAGAGQAAASAYSVYRGLSVPLRSSIYRGLQSSTYGYAGAVEEAAPYAVVVYAGGNALYTAGSAAYNGECH